MGHALAYTWLSLNVLVLLANGVLNGAVLVAVCFKRSLVEKRYGILISLAVADLLQIIPVLAHVIKLFTGLGKREDAISCVALSSIRLILICITILHLVVESINRLMIITRPLKYAIWLTPRKFTSALALVWLVPVIGIMGPFALYNHPSEWHQSMRIVMFSCDVIEVDQLSNQTHINQGHMNNFNHLNSSFMIYASVITVVYFAVPIIVMAVSYSIIFKVSLKHIRELRRLEGEMRRLNRRYSLQNSSAVFDTNSSYSRAGSFASITSNATERPPSTIFSFNSKRNAVAPFAAHSMTMLRTPQLRNNTAEGMSDDHGLAQRNSTASSHTRQAWSASSAKQDPRILLDLSKYTRRVDHNDGDNNDNCEENNNVGGISNRIKPETVARDAHRYSGSEDSGHGTGSQISNAQLDNNNHPEAITQPSLTPIKPDFQREYTNLSSIFGDDNSDVEARSTSSTNGKCRGDMNLNNEAVNRELYDLLSGFSIMGAYAEHLKTRSVAQRSSFSRFHAIIKDELRNRKQEIQLVKTLGGLILAWLLFYLPILIYTWDELLVKWSYSEQYTPNNDLGLILLVWALLDSAVNPVVYCLRIPEFKRAIANIRRQMTQAFY
eukprot:gene16085-17708_t